MLGNTGKESSHLPFPPANLNAPVNHQYTLKITVESIIWHKELEDYSMTISFCNPIHQKFYSIPHNVNIRFNERTYLENINCRMYLEIPSDKVVDFFSKWSPTIIFCDKENELLSYVELNLGQFKFKSSRERFFSTKVLFDQSFPMKERVGSIDIILTVYDNKIKVTSSDDTYIGVPIFFKITEQLEDWKEKQKRIFRLQEEERLEMETEKWKIDKSRLEEKLLKNICDTNNILAEIKAERDFVKAAIEVELSKPAINQIQDEVPKTDTKQKKTTIWMKTKVDTKPKEPTAEQKEIKWLHTVIEDQNEEIKLLKEKLNKPSPQFQKLLLVTDQLRKEIELKNQEINYLKQQWAKATRHLNAHKKYEKAVEAKYSANQNRMVPVLVEQLLNLESKEQKRDLEQLETIRKELAEYDKNKKQNEISQEKTELETLLQTRTYNKKDKVIKLLSQRKK